MLSFRCLPVMLDHNSMLDTSLVHVLPEESTAVYTVMLDSSGEAKMGVGDMLIHSSVTPAMFDDALAAEEPSVVVVDG